MTVTKLFFNSVISDQGSTFTTADVTDYFLMTQFDNPEQYEYMWISLDMIPDEIQTKYSVKDFAICINNV